MIKHHYLLGTGLGLESTEVKSISLPENSETSGEKQVTNKLQCDVGMLH